MDIKAIKLCKLMHICAIIYNLWCQAFDNKFNIYFLQDYIFFDKYKYKYIRVDKKRVNQSPDKPKSLSTQVIVSSNFSQFKLQSTKIIVNPSHSQTKLWSNQIIVKTSHCQPKSESSLVIAIPSHGQPKSQSIQIIVNKYKSGLCQVLVIPSLGHSMSWSSQVMVIPSHGHQKSWSFKLMVMPIHGHPKAWSSEFIVHSSHIQAKSDSSQSWSPQGCDYCSILA